MDEFYDRAHQNDIQDGTRNRLEPWEEHLKSPLAALAKALDCLEDAYECKDLGSQAPCLSHCPPGWRRPCWEGVWPSLDPWDVVGLRTTASVWNVPKKCGPYGELFMFLTTKEQTNHEKVVGFERDTEDGMSSSEEEGGHIAENFMLCCCAHRACSPLLQESLHEEELRKVALRCQVSLDVLYLCQR